MAFVGVGVLATASTVLRPAPVFGAPKQVTNFQTAPNATLCYMPQSGAYSVGAVEARGTDLYRCSLIFDQNLQPAGVAWIKMAQQTVYVPKPGL
jgi:hypothetical protein